MYLMCVQNILQTDESTIICMIFGLNKYNTIIIFLIKDSSKHAIGKKM
jgi:hypothetical protein